MPKTESPLNSPLLPAVINALLSGLLTFPPWAKLLLWKLEYPCFILAVIGAVIGTVLALQFKKGNTKFQIFWGITFCCAVIGYYMIWSMTGSPDVLLLYFGVFLVFVIFLIGGYFLTLLLVLLLRKQNSVDTTTNSAEETTS